MTSLTLIRRSLGFHWRAHLGVVLGAAAGSAALIGALVVGDSVKGSLRRQALNRLNKIQVTLDAGDRLFRDMIAAKLRADLPHQANGKPQLFASVLRKEATAIRADQSARANQIQLLGVEADFWLLASAACSFSSPARGEVILGEPLSRQLHAAPGDTLLFRVAAASRLSSDAALISKSDSSRTMRLRVSAIASATGLGTFSIRSASTPAWNAFVNLNELQERLGRAGKANVLLLGSDLVSDHVPTFTLRLQSYAQPAFDRLFSLADAELGWRQPPNHLSMELRTERVFLDAPIVRAALAADPNAQPILTYLATLLVAGTNSTPYSMVTAAGGPWTPADLRDDEIVASQWLAEDLRVKPGDAIAMSYFLPESGAKLSEATNTFRVRRIVPMDMPWADRTLMPDFPGIEKAESTSEWDAGFPLTYKVRPKDDDYWKRQRGTPKAFISLAAGQKMWGNRFGNLTTIRFPIPTNAPLTRGPSPTEEASENRSPALSETNAASHAAGPVEEKTDQQLSPLPGGEGQGHGPRQATGRAGSPLPAAGSQLESGTYGGTHPTNIQNYRAALEKKILATLKPEELGLSFEPVREQALKAAAQAQDFGGLFLGFSFFVIGAALLLMALLLSLGLEQRAAEIGTLLALGFTPKQVRSLLLREGVGLAFLGGGIGALGGLAYAKAMLRGLATIWRDAVPGSALSFHFTAQTLVIGWLASVMVSVVTIWLTLRKFGRRPAMQLLTGADLLTSQQNEGSGDKSPPSKVGWFALVGALALLGSTQMSRNPGNAGAFFGAGALGLVAGLGFVNSWLGQMARLHYDPRPQERENSPQSHGKSGATARSLTLSRLGMRGCARRRKRSLATVAMLACGSFLIVSIGVFRLDANRDSTKRSSGTGGFALIGETTMPVVQDLNSKSGREFFALNEADLNGVSFVPFRVREGDEASCLNLNRAQKPRLLGVKPELMEGRFTFAKGAGWAGLRAGAGQASRLSPAKAGEIPAIGDANSIQWAMGKKVGDTIDYVDQRGQPFKVRIVGAVANSILQGQLIIDEAEFVKRFPGGSGDRMFLVDAPSNTVAQLSARVSRAMQDVGLELTPTAQRLDQFNAVQNTYLGTFQVLGGLGLLLGSVGLGIVVLRNVLERRGELAVLLAVGFRQRTLQRLLLIENGALLVVGLALGTIAAAVAVLPALFSASTPLPYASLALTLAAVLVNGALWTWAATRVALRGDLLTALRNE